MCEPEHLQIMAEHAVNMLEAFDGQNLYMRGPMCHTCCATGSGRVRIVFVRNPFARIMSYYKYNWRSKTSFPQFVHLASRDPRLCDPRDADGNCSGRALFGRVERMHVVPVSRWVGLLPQQQGPSTLDLLVIHLELLDRGLEDLQLRLCRDFRFCVPLPRLPHKNRGPADRAPQPSVKDSQSSHGEWWTAASRQAVLRWHAGDFEAFGYSNDPERSTQVRFMSGTRCGQFRFVGPAS